MIDTCYPLDIWNIGAGLGSECLCDQLPVVSLGTKSLMSFPDGQYFTCIVTFVTGGIRSRWFHWESTVGACASGLHPCLFFLAWFCLCSFGVIKLWVQLYVDSHESFVEPEGGLGDPWDFTEEETREPGLEGWMSLAGERLVFQGEGPRAWRWRWYLPPSFFCLKRT